MEFRFRLPRKKPDMSITPLSRKSPAALLLTCLALFTTSALAQSPPSSLEKEVQEMRTENTAIREQIGKLEEQQRALLNAIDQLQRKLDGRPAVIAQQSPPPAQPASAPAPQATVPPKPAAPATQPVAD